MPPTCSSHLLHVSFLFHSWSDSPFFPNSFLPHFNPEWFYNSKFYWYIFSFLHIWSHFALWYLTEWGSVFTWISEELLFSWWVNRAKNESTSLGVLFSEEGPGWWVWGGGGEAGNRVDGETWQQGDWVDCDRRLHDSENPRVNLNYQKKVLRKFCDALCYLIFCAVLGKPTEKITLFSKAIKMRCVFLLNALRSLWMLKEDAGV